MRKALASLMVLVAIVTFSTTMAARGKALANVVRCVTRTDTGTVKCQKFPEWRAHHPEIDHWIKTTYRRNGLEVITMQFPVLYKHTPPPPPVAHPVAYMPTQTCKPSPTCYPMLITWYAWTGHPMADGVYPYIGAAACGYDILPETYVKVPGVGVLKCEDHIGYIPWHHIDVYGIPLGTGYRMVQILG